MGCFDFHYADRYKNMGNRGGYYVVPKYLKEDIGLDTNYIRFDYSDDYGRLYLDEDRYIDVYNLYSIQILSYYKDELGIDKGIIKGLYELIKRDNTVDIRSLGIYFNGLPTFTTRDINKRVDSNNGENKYLKSMATAISTPLIITMEEPSILYEDFKYVSLSGQYYGKEIKCKWIKDGSYKELRPTELKEFDSEYFVDKFMEYDKIEDKEIRKIKMRELFKEEREVGDYNNKYINKLAYDSLKDLVVRASLYYEDIKERYTIGNK